MTEISSPLDPESATPAPIPPEVPGFILHSLLGRGSSGVVWRATQEGTLREVALKLLAPWRVHGLAPLRFEREAEITASLEHDAIARVFGAGTGETGPWIAMEWVDGPPADVWVAQTAPPLHDRIRFFRHVCAGMSHAHQRGVIHRDLKPGNILVTPEGDPKIVDFGLARRASPSSLEVSLTREGDFLGTLAWMPPEQASGRWEDVDALSDVSALGAILFGLITERPPIDANLPPAAQLAAAQAGDRLRLREVAPHAPRDLEAVIARCLAPKKSDRYQSVAELEADLDRWLAGEPVRAPVGAPLYWLRKKLRRHWVAAGSTAVAVLAVTGLAAGYLAGKARLEAEKQAALRREADQRKKTLQEAQELMTQLLMEMRPYFEKAGHPEWIEEAEKRVASFPWDETAGGTYDSRRFRGRSALVLGDTLAARDDWHGALDAYHDAVRQYQPLVREQPDLALFREELVRARLGECKALLKIGYAKEAYLAATRVLEVTDPAQKFPVSAATTADVRNAILLLCEATSNHPASTADALATARRAFAQSQLEASPPSPDPVEAQARAKIALWIARLSSRLEDRVAAKQAAADAEKAARDLVATTGQTELSVRLLTSVLVVIADGALADGDPGGACRVLDEATTMVIPSKRKPPEGQDTLPHEELGAAWERAGRFIAERGDSTWAMQANDRAIELWTVARQQRRRADSLAALSRLCLANTKLARHSGNPSSFENYANMTVRKILHGIKDNTARPTVAVNAIEGALLLIESGTPDRPGSEPWLTTALAARQWLRESPHRIHPDLEKRLADFDARLEKIAAPP